MRGGARATDRPVVALESTIISHGLPRPRNLRGRRGRSRQTVREHGAVPATIGMVGGDIVVGLDDAELDPAGRPPTACSSSPSATWRSAAATGVDGATTVAAHGGDRGPRPASASSPPAGSAGSTGARPSRTTSRPTWSRWRRTPIMVVCAGVKSILDVGATLERLETLGVTRGRLRHDAASPGFYLTDGGFDLDWSLDVPGRARRGAARAGATQGVHRARWSWPTRCRSDEQLDPALHDRVLAEGLAGLERDGVTGKAVTPYLLAHFHEATGGRAASTST